MSQAMYLDGVLMLAEAATPWFSNPGMTGGLFGAAVGVFGALYGALLGILASRGKARGLILTMHWTGVSIGLTLLALSITALFTGQPYAIWYGLGLPGVILTFLLLIMTPVVQQRYREAEQRRLEAENFRRG